MSIFTSREVFAQTAPGGVSGMTAWYKGDLGLADTFWEDQSVNDYHLERLQSPSSSSSINFNPVASFEGVTAHQFNNLSPKLLWPVGNNSATTYYYIAKNHVEIANRAVFGIGVSNDSNGFHSGQQATSGFIASRGVVTFANNQGSAIVISPPNWDVTESNQGLNMVRTGFDGGGATGRNYIAAQGGGEFTNSQDVNPNYANNAPFRIGSSGANSAFWNGDIAEVIVYEGKHDLVTVNRVESYLALKYGITKVGDYVDANDNVFFNSSVFNNNIAGIGRDDESGLHQKQSMSQNAGRQILIGNGNSLSESNSSNTNEFVDGQFLVWGDNGLKTQLEVPLAHIGSGGVINNHFSAIWQVQNTNTVGAVTIAWPVGINNLHLIRSSDANFDSSDDFVSMDNIVTINGVEYNTAVVNFNDGDFFTLAGFANSPGGVALGLGRWYRADIGIDLDGDRINSLIDQVDQSIIINQPTLNRRPTYLTGENGINFNPSMAFVRNPHAGLNSLEGGIAPGTNGITTFAVALPNVSPVLQRNYIFGMTDVSQVNNLPTVNEKSFAVGNVGSNSSNPSIGKFRNLTVYSSNGTFEAGMPSIIKSGSRPAPDNISFFISQNGGPSVFGNGDVAMNYSDKGFGIASGGDNHQDNNVYGWNGQIMEVILYEGELSPQAQRRVESYLAIKYGITLENTNDYLSASESVIWDATANSTYYNNVFGIAKSEASSFDQKQSRSINPSQQLVISTTGLANSNELNVVSLSDDQSLMVGDNGLSQSGIVEFLITNLPNGSELNFRFESIWKVQNTNDVGTVTVAWPAVLGNLHLVVSDDEVFTDQDEFYEMNNIVNLNGIDHATATVTLNDGAYFTLAGFNFGPGGVNAGLGAWHRADAFVYTDEGSNLASSGQSIQQWGEFNSSGIDFSQPTAARRPIYTPDVMLNFNPTVRFTRTSVQWMSYTFPTSTIKTEGTLYFAAKDNTNGYGAGILGFDPSMDFPGWHRMVNNNYLIFNNNFTTQLANPIDITIPNLLGSTWRNGAGSTAGNLLFNTRYNGFFESFNTVNNITVSTNHYRIGQDTNYGAYNGNIGESIYYSRELDTEEQNRVDSYLAIKYGSTLRSGDFNTGTFDYVSSTGNIVWEGSSNPDFHNNVFGLGRDDSSVLSQNVSSSENPVSEAKLIVATSRDFGSSNTDPTRVEFEENSTFIMFGDNNLTGETEADIDPCTGLPLDIPISRTNKIWRVETNGNPEPIWLQIDLNDFDFNSDIEIWVADDENFTNNLVKLPAASYEGGIATFNFLFTEGVKYMSFAGVIAPSNCDVCTGGSFTFKTGRSWDTSAERISNVMDPETIGTTNQGDLIVNMEANFPAGIEYAPNAYPRPYGRWFLSRRRDNQDLEAIHSIVLNQTVAGASFQISNINTYLENANKFTVIGYDCDGNVVLPKITHATNPTAATTYEIMGNQVVGTKQYRGLTFLHSTANVRFNRAIERIDVVFEVDRVNALQTLRSLDIGDISFECALALPPTVDNISIVQDFTQSEDVPSCIETTMRMRFVNSNCDTKIINVSQTLPNGLEFVSDTYNDAEFSAPTPFTFDPNNFVINGLELPSGTTFLYINVRSTDGISAVYNTSSNFTVEESGNSYSSINPAGGEFSQVGFEANSATVPNVELLYEVNEACLEIGDQVIYTLNFNNQDTEITGANLRVYYDVGQSIASIDFNNGVSGVLGFDPIGEAYIEIEDLTIPTGQSSIDVLIDITNQIFNTENFVSSIFELVVQPDNPCSEEAPLVSNEILLTNCGFCTQPGSTDPATEFTQRGISDREGFEGWPQGVPNGFLAIESENQGFVITRVQNVNDVPEPVEGMLVYEIDDECIKLYNGTTWNCIQRSCNN